MSRYVASRHKIIEILGWLGNFYHLGLKISKQIYYIKDIILVNPYCLG